MCRYLCLLSTETMPGEVFSCNTTFLDTQLTYTTSTVSHGKVTPAVRKILLSQKTFANHLSDAEALAALTSSQPQVAPPPTPAARTSPASSSAPKSQFTSTAKRLGKKKDPSVTA